MTVLEQPKAAATITQNRWGCTNPDCLILDEHDEIMQRYDGRERLYLRCKHCGTTTLKPVSVAHNRKNGRLRRRPHKPQVTCPRCGEVGSASFVANSKDIYIYHCSQALGKLGTRHYIQHSQRYLIYEQIRLLEPQQT